MSDETKTEVLEEGAAAAEAKHDEKKKDKHKKDRKEQQGEHAEAAKDDARGKVTYEAELSREEATNYLEALIRGVYAGKLHMRQGEDELELSPCGAIKVSVKASRKGPKEKITFELKWRTGGEGDLAID
ncbi:MAG: amphi-Trp domain-containing protein [Planctomycetes bacterium]|nr:amphi-Trp domain-containing protein [Planctomycetota bacterium]